MGRPGAAAAGPRRRRRGSRPSRTGRLRRSTSRSRPPRSDDLVGEVPRGSAEHEADSPRSSAKRANPLMPALPKVTQSPSDELSDLADQRGRVHAGLDDGGQHVLHHGVRLRHYADLPPMLLHELGDHVRAHVGLAGARWTLNRQVRAVQIQQRRDQVRLSGAGVVESCPAASPRWLCGAVRRHRVARAMQSAPSACSASDLIARRDAARRHGSAGHQCHRQLVVVRLTRHARPR